MQQPWSSKTAAWGGGHLIKGGLTQEYQDFRRWRKGVQQADRKKHDRDNSRSHLIHLTCSNGARKSDTFRSKETYCYVIPVWSARIGWHRGEEEEEKMTQAVVSSSPFAPASAAQRTQAPKEGATGGWQPGQAAGPTLTGSSGATSRFSKVSFRPISPGTPYYVVARGLYYYVLQVCHSILDLLAAPDHAAQPARSWSPTGIISTPLAPGFVSCCILGFSCHYESFLGALHCNYTATSPSTDD